MSGKVFNPIAMSEDMLNQFSDEEQLLLKPLKSAVVNMEAVIKFHKNQQTKQLNKNPFISWTLNKAAVIDKTWLNLYKEKIQDMSWWRVKIERESSPGQPYGCFIVRPLWEVKIENLVILAPTTWSKVQQGLTVVLYPKIKPWMPWIIPKALRKMIMKKTNGAALVIPLSYPPEGDPEESLRGKSIFAEKNTETDILNRVEIECNPEIIYRGKDYQEEEL